MLNQQQQLASNYKHPEQMAGVLLQPNVYLRLQRGINKVVDAIRPTLGPRPRLVGIERYSRSIAPELLDDGGTIARRIIELPDQHENVGAMLVRGMLYRLQEQVGDGTATAAVLFQAIFNEGVRYLAAGGSAMILRQHLEEGLKVITTQLDQEVSAVDDPRLLRQIAKTVCEDDGLAAAIGDIFETIGEFGVLDIQSGHMVEPRQAYFEGNYWTGGVHTSTTDANNQPIELLDAAIVLTDFALETQEQVIPILRAALQAQISSLVIMARSVSDKVVRLLSSSQASSRMRVVVVKTPGATSIAQAEALTDLALLTGGQALIEVAGDSLQNVRAAHFGQARRIWMDKNYIGIKGGKGDIKKLRQHLADLHCAYDKLDDAKKRAPLRERIGRLQGGFAILYVGGATQTEIETRKEIAKRAAQIIGRVSRDGVLLGGGMALLSCRALLEKRIKHSLCADERAAYRILRDAVKSPFCTLAHNAGYESGAILAQIEHEGAHHGFDFEAGCVKDFHAAGIYDSAAAQIEAVKHAVKTAALALTIDAVVYRKQPETSMLPE